MRVGLSLVLAACLGAGLAPAHAEDPASEGVRVELRAIRQSLDQLVVLLREMQQQSSRRDAITALASRIQSAEKRLDPMAEEVRTVRRRKQEEEAALAKVEGGFGALQEMEKADAGGAAAAAFEAERGRMNAEAGRRKAALAQLSQQLTALEQDLLRRRQSIDQLDSQLERLLAGK